MDVFENERGTYIFNSKDLCMIEYIPELVKSGIMSFKIEGRVKTEYYVATVVKTYREALDSYLDNPDKYEFKKEWMDELLKVSNRHYTTGFFLGKPDTTAQVYTSSAYIRNYNVCAVVIGYDEETGETILEQRNKFSVGDEVEIIMPKEKFISHTVTKMTNEENEEIESAPHARQIIKINFGRKLPEMAMMRKRRED